jgi:cell division protein FtsB
MSKKNWLIVLFLVVSLGATIGLTGCGQSGTSQETEDLKKELEDLKKQKEDEKLVEEKQDLAKQQEDLETEKQKLESEKKKAQAKKKGVQPVKNGEVYEPGQTVYIRISKGSLNLRSRPDNSSSVLATGGNSDEVEMIEYDKTWCKVRFNGKVGFMATTFLYFAQTN